MRSHHFLAIFSAPEFVYAYTRSDFLALMREVVNRADLIPVDEISASFEPSGVSAIVLLKESHLALHFWPERGKVSIDLHVCDYLSDNRDKAENAIRYLSAYLNGSVEQWKYVLVSG